MALSRLREQPNQVRHIDPEIEPSWNPSSFLFQNLQPGQDAPSCLLLSPGQRSLFGELDRALLDPAVLDLTPRRPVEHLGQEVACRGKPEILMMARVVSD